MVKAGEIRGFVAGVDASGLDAREIQQRVDQLQQPLPIPIGDIHVGRGVRRQRLAGSAQDVLQRADHQRQRRPELVRDVREERRLGAIEFRQRFRPPPFVLECLRVGQRRRELGCDQPEERSIVLVERAHRAHRCDEDRARVFLARQQNGQHHGAVRRHLPCAGRQRAETRPQLMDDGGLTRPDDCTQRPRIEHALVQRDTGRRRIGANANSGNGLQPRGRVAVVHAVDQRERHVLRIRGKDGRGGLVGGLLAVGALAPGRQVTQRAQAALADHLLGGLNHRTEDAADLPALGMNRAVREREVGLFGVSAIDVQQQVPRTRRLGTLVDLREHRADDVPDFRPDLGPLLTQRGGVLGRPEHRPVLVVVENREVGSPPEDDGKGTIETGADRSTEGLRPALDRPEGGPGPVELAHASRHLALSREDILDRRPRCGSITHVHDGPGQQRECRAGQS